jgi:hypothetical protein
MSRLRSLTLIALCASVPLVPPAARGQSIPVRTVPLAAGEQFRIFPSRSMGMGGVRLAIDDPLGDAWSNPAKGALLGESAFLGSPTFYSISGGAGAGRTLPAAGTFTGSRWFAGVALALQQVEDSPGGEPAIWSPWIDWWEPTRRLSDAYARNLYAAGFFGLRIGSRWSIGLGLAASSLDAMDGVDLLYSGASGIEQSGGTQDVRMGIHRQGERDRLSLLLVHSRLAMSHDVTYTEWAWDTLTMAPIFRERVEVNEDRTRTWGTHLEWSRDLAAPGWRVGASATANHKDHPKIPNYDIQNIPRDPGTTWAYETAVGFARELGPNTFALELAFQPIWSETWQEADSAAVADSGGRLSLGDRSIENDFFFTNVVIRTGIAHEAGRATFQGGLEVESYAYTLEQVSHVGAADLYREQDETWMEWTPTLGAAFRFTGIDVQYALRITSGTGRPGIDQPTPIGILALEQADGDFIIAPQSPLTLQEARVLTHQFSLRVPVR